MNSSTPTSQGPEETRRNPLLNLDSRFWMALGWVLLALALAFPFPWW
jgi:hypothetical protein